MGPFDKTGGAMTDLQAKLERFETLAAECNLIGGYLATDAIKRELYLRLAKNYRQLADDVRRVGYAKDAAY